MIVANPALAAMQGTQGALGIQQQAANMRRANALEQLYQTQGAGIASGNQQAVNALASLDPMAARGIFREQRQDQRADQQFALQSRVSEQQLQLARAQGERQAQQFAMQMDAATLAQEQQKLEQGLAAGLSAQTPEQWDAAMQAVGSTDLVGRFEEREILIASAQGLQAGLARMAPQDPSNRFKVAGGTLFDLQAEGGPQPVGQGQGTERVVYGPDGQPVFSEGPTGTSRRLTEGQSKDNVYLTRAEGALAALDPVADTLVSRTDRVLEGVPLGIGRGGQSEDFQVAQQAGEEFLQAILRKDTGAAITEQEQFLYGRTLLPQPGDQPEVLRAKELSRARAVEAIRSGMSIDQIIGTERARINALRRVNGGEAAAPQEPAAPQQPSGAPEVGTVDGGFVFKGGDPADPNSWERQ